MKFGQYLQENLTPEWKRAYIDYRACKKTIKVIANRLAKKDPYVTQREAVKAVDHSSDDDDVGPTARPRQSPSIRPLPARSTDENVASPGEAMAARGELKPTPSLTGHGASRRAGASPNYGAMSTSPRPMDKNDRKMNPPPLDLGESSLQDGRVSDKLGDVPENHEADHTSMEGRDAHRDPRESVNSSEGSNEHEPEDGSIPSASQQHLTSDTPSRAKDSPRGLRSPRFFNSPWHGAAAKEAASPGSRRKAVKAMTTPSALPKSGIAQTFEQLYQSLETDERAFFDLLERELDKVESFYAARIADAQRRAHELREQLRELAEHRRIFHKMYPNGLPEWEAKVGRFLPVTGNGSAIAGMAKNLRKRLPFLEEGPHVFHHHDQGAAASDDKPRGTTRGSVHSASNASDQVADDASIRTERLREEMNRDAEHLNYHPEKYSKYKRDLRGATMEFYRQLELIKNYRIMNLTGFRKALKKFEKTTKIHCLELYTDEKISKKSFAKGKTVENLIRHMEDLYTEHFEHGDGKKARNKLRRQQRMKTHYFSVFRSGLMLGLAVPPAILALVKAGESETRRHIPQTDGLLQVYGGLFLPVIFALLFQLNLDAYVKARINFEFVMELSQPTLDYRSFAEIPAFLFLTLSYCFFFSFYRVATDNVAPTTWPLAWIVFVCVFFLNPLPIFRRRSRYWFLRVLFRVFTPGYSRVEFIAFFIADELNSLVYTMQNWYFIGCAYGHDWPGGVYQTCPSGQSWPYAVLLSVPALIRLIQCIKRWHDCRLNIHLINAGKYGSSILQYCLFVLWRARGRSITEASFIVWVIAAIIQATYTSSWDIIVDWSLLRRDSGLLRPDLGYSSRYAYYFAMVSNVLIRFVWVWYLPNRKVHTTSRSFYFALAEMLRRWQWNFFRVETEHLGNADAYRVTREVPLPYRRADQDSDDDDGDDKGDAARGRPNAFAFHLDRFKKELVGGNMHGRGPNEANVGPRGHVRQREYEARRPEDEDEDEMRLGPPV